LLAGDASQPVDAKWNPIDVPARIYERAVVVLNVADVPGGVF